jgi:PAS domain S-box-containing protein
MNPMKRLLIVDDKEENVYYLSALLTGSGFTVDSARHGAEALVKARLAMPDAIISDLLMPVMDGYTLLRLWKADAQLKSIPFIVYTATYTEPEDERLALSLGADVFILKPAEPEDFLARIREVLANTAARIPIPAKYPTGDEKELLKVYSETLIRKLEEKTLQLEETNRALQRDIAERKRTEQEREQYFKFFQISNDLMVFADPQGHFKKVNPACWQTLGYSETELLGKSVLDLVHPDDRAATAMEMEQQIRAGSSMSFINRCLCRDGSIRWLAWRATYVAAEHQTYATARDITERQQSEAALRLLNSAVLQTSEAILITDAELNRPGPKIVFANPAFTQMTGYTAEEVIGKTPRILQGLRTDKVILHQLRKNLDRGEVFRGEAINYRKDGTEYHQEWQIAPLYDATRKITHFVSILRDITERKQTQQALRESQEKFSKIFESSPMAMALSTLDEGRYLDVNREFLQILQRTREEVIGHTSLELNVWAEPEQRAVCVARFKAAGMLRNVELKICGKAGQISNILWSVEAVNIAGENCLLGSLLDITERKRAEEELRWKTAFLEAQVDCSVDGILVVDSRGKKILQNQPLIRVWKIPPAIAENTDDAVQVEFIAHQTKDPQEFLAKVAHLNAHPDEVSRDEIELVDGTILDRYSSPVRDKTGNYYGRIWAFRDITPQRKLEEQLRQSQKMEAFGQLAGGVAHDFNNILAVIRLQAGLLRTEPGLSMEQLEFAHEIEKAAERAANLTRQLLFFSRKQAMQPRDVKLKDLVDNMTKMLQRTLGEQVRVQFKFAAESLVIRADPGMMDQILLNLVVNARDAMPKGGQIIVETSAAEFDEVTAAKTPQARPGLFACLSVSDTGCGMPPDILLRIFEPFFTTKEVGKGTGLGLATVFGIVQQHQGWINVSSEVGRGSTFRVYLPRQAKTTDTEFFWSSRAVMRGGSETIFLVEDECEVRSSVRITLTRLGYHVLEAANGEEALAAWKQHSDEVQLLLTDLVMPGKMNGKELASELLQQKPKLKVIYASGHSAEVAGKELLLEEGVNFLVKPFKANELAQAIRNNLDKPA